MVIRLGHGIAHTKSPAVGCVLFDDIIQRAGVVVNHPVCECRADVKADMFEVAQFSVRLVALGVDTFVPIRIGGGAIFQRDDTCQGIFPRGLVEVGMDDESSMRHVLRCASTFIIPIVKDLYINYACFPPYKFSRFDRASARMVQSTNGSNSGSMLVMETLAVLVATHVSAAIR